MDPDLLREFAGSLVRITDDSGNEIGVGRLDEEGVVRGTIDGVDYVQKLSRLVVEDDDSAEMILPESVRPEEKK